MENNIYKGSRTAYKMTDEYKNKVYMIKKQIGLKYRDFELNEKGFFRKLILKIQKRTEIRKAINDLTSLDKMYSVN